MLRPSLCLPFCVFVLLGVSVPCAAVPKGEKKPKMSMAERKEQARQAAEERREQAKQRAEERRLKNRSKAEQEADALAAQQAEALARHAAEQEEAAAEAKRQAGERERNKRDAEHAHSDAVRNRLDRRKEALERFDIRKGEEWTVHTDGLKAFRLLDEAQRYVKLAAEDAEEAKLFAEDLEDDTMILVAKGGHLLVKATNADSLLPSVGDLRELPEDDETAAAFDTRVKAAVYLKNAAEARGLIRVRSRRKDELWVLYRDLLEFAAPPEREEEPEAEEEPAAEEEERDTYEYGDDLV